MLRFKNKEETRAKQHYADYDGVEVIDDKEGEGVLYVIINPYCGDYEYRANFKNSVQIWPTSEEFFSSELFTGLSKEGRSSCECGAHKIKDAGHSSWCPAL